MQWKQKELTTRGAELDLSPLLTTFVALGELLDLTAPSIFLFIKKKKKEKKKRIIR